MESNQIIPLPSNKNLQWWESQEKIKLLKNTLSKGLSDNQFQLFLYACQRSGLDPFMRQIYAIIRKSKNSNGQYEDIMTIQTGIDGFRLIAERTGKYSPGRESTFTYDKDGGLLSATAYIKKRTDDGTWHEIAATVFFEEYCARNKEGQLIGFWKDKAHIMLSKCAEAAALRRAFPADLSGLYTKEEINDESQEVAIEAKEESSKMPDFISEEQCQEIEGLMEKCSPALRNRIFDRYQTKQVKNIPAKSYGIVKQAILKEIEEKKKAECEVTQVAFEAFQKREVAHA